MSDDRPEATRTVAASEAPCEADPDRLPDTRPGAKKMTLREVVEAERETSRQRRAARLAVGMAPR